MPERAKPERGSLRFSFEGRVVTARDGDTVAAALLAHGVRVFGRSSKYHRPRGYRCGEGACSCCAMRVDGLPGVRTCVTPVRDGMVVEREHAWPSAEQDLLRGAELAAPLLHAGFYYRRFRRSPWAWRIGERVLARAAGQGELPDTAAARRLAGARLLRRPDVRVLVAGGGAAGLSAALAAAEAGAPVLLVERHPALGGGAAADARVAGLAARVAREPRIEALTGAEVAGWYDEGAVAVVCGADLLLVEPAAVVLAPGLHERVLPFRGHDLPGVMTAGAARRLLRAGVLPGRRVVVVTDRADGYALAGELAAGPAAVGRAAAAAGRPGGAAAVPSASVRGLACDVVAVADLRAAAGLPEAARSALTTLGVRLYAGLRDMTGHGRSSIAGVTLALREGDAGRSRRQRVACDAVCMAVGGRPADELARQALAGGHYTLGPVTPEAPGATTDTPEAPGAAHVPSGPAGTAFGARVFLAGAAAGCDSVPAALADGASAGRRAAGSTASQA